METSDSDSYWYINTKIYKENNIKLIQNFCIGESCCSVDKLCSTLCNPMDSRTSGFLVLYHLLDLLKLMSIESMMPSNHLILCRHLLLLPSIFQSIRVFSNELALCIRQPKYWNFSFSISPSNEYSGLTSFSMDWLDLLPVQGFSRV